MRPPGRRGSSLRTAGVCRNRGAWSAGGAWAGAVNRSAEESRLIQESTPDNPKKMRFSSGLCVIDRLKGVGARVDE